MKRPFHRHAFVMALACLAFATHAADDAKSPPEKDNFFERAARVIGNDAKTGAKQAGQAFKQLGKDIGHGTSKAAKDIGHSVKRGVKKTGKEAKEAAK